MKYAIISAGEGSRLAQEGITAPKPLVTIQGECMIDRLIRIFSSNGAEEIIVIVNDLTNDVQAHLAGLHTDVPLRVVVKTTPSSMHSFHAISPYLAGERFCLTTVDTIFHEEEFHRFIQAFLSDTSLDALMGVTAFIDDEKPLYVATHDDMRVEGFYDSLGDFRMKGDPQARCRFVSGGLYALGPRAIDTLNRCMEKGMARMRNFQRQLVSDKLHVKAYTFSKVLDVDHASDIAKAEQFVSQGL